MVIRLVVHFLKNTNALRVINSVTGHVQKGNCPGRKHKVDRVCSTSKNKEAQINSIFFNLQYTMHY